MLAIQPYTPLSIGAACACGLPGIDMAIRAIQDVDILISTRIENDVPADESTILKQRRIRKIKGELAQHVIGATLLGVCAANLFPGAPFIGLAGYLIYSKKAWKKESQKENPSPLTLGTGFAMEILWLFKKQLITSAFKGFCKGIKAVVKGASVLTKKVTALFRHIIHGLKVAVVTLLKVMVKCSTAVFKAMFRHPVVSAALLLGTIAFTALWILAPSGTAAAVGLIAGKLIGATWSGLKLIPSIAMKALSTLTTVISHSTGPLLNGITFTAKAIGTIVLFIPSAIYHTLAAIGSIARFILRV